MGIRTLSYHSGLKSKERSEVQDSWTSGEVPVIAATCSFGMGVDKATVRFVVHWTVPQTVASYYQESGRAGRDGKQSFCRVYFSREEFNAINFLCQNSADEESTTSQYQSRQDYHQAKMKSFKQIVESFTTAKCRHALFSKYFGDPVPQCVNRCDVCKNKDAVRERLLKFESTNHYKPNRKEYLDSFGLDKYDYTEKSYGGDSDDSGESVRKELDKQARQEERQLIKEQFQLRRGAKMQDIEVRKLNLECAKKSCVLAAESTDIKVKGLTVNLREFFYKKINNGLLDNFKVCDKECVSHLTENDITTIAQKLEYNMICNTTALPAYRCLAMQKVSYIQKCTKNKELCDDLKKNNDLKTDIDDDIDDHIHDDGNEDHEQKDCEVEQKEFNFGKSSLSECGGFKTALQLKNNSVSGESGLTFNDKKPVVKQSTVGSSSEIVCNGFKTALEISNANKDKVKESKPKKKSDSHSITDFFKGSFNKTKKSELSDQNKSKKNKAITDFFKSNSSEEKINEARDDNIQPKKSNEEPNGSFNTELQMSSSLVKEFNNSGTFSNPKPMKKEVEVEEVSAKDGLKINEEKSKSTDKKSHRVNSFKPKVPSKSKLAIKTALLFGEDLSPEHSTESDDTVNKLSSDISKISADIDGNSQNKYSISVIDKKVANDEKSRTQEKPAQHAKRAYSDLKEAQSLDKVVQDSKRQRVNNDANNKVPVKKTQESIRIHRKTFNILKPIVMEYYVSSYIPDAAKFKVIFKKIHTDVLERQIYDHEGIKALAVRRIKSKRYLND